jgi:hypothetical protein
MGPLTEPTLPDDVPVRPDCARDCGRPTDGASIFCIQHASEYQQQTGVSPPGPEGAICFWCGAGMMVAPGCIEEPRELIDGAYDPVRVGHERSYPFRSRCPDCGAQPDHVHHPGCDIEECPRCGRQLISCGCYPEDDEWSPE